MAKLLQIDFDHDGPYGKDMAQAFRELAKSIAAEPGFLWKIWTENQERGEAGGIYLFADQSSADAYLAKHTRRLAEFGMSNVNAKVFDVNEALSKITKAPIQ